MIKPIKVVTLATVVALLGMMILATAAFAQGPNPDSNQSGPWSQDFQNRAGLSGLLQEYDAIIHQAVADALHMSLTDFETGIANGETIATLASAQGVELSDVFAAMQEGRQAAVAQALADGVISQYQAEQMLERMGGQNGQSSGFNNQQRSGDPDNCPGQPEDAPGDQVRRGRRG